MNLADIPIKAVEGRANCAGCIYKGESFRACVAHSDKAVQRGLPDCDDKAPSGKSYIYVADDSDPRQMALPEVGK